MRLSLLRPRNWLSITPWLKRSVLPFTSNRKKWVYGPNGMENPSTFDKTEMLGLDLLTDGKYDEFRVVSPASIRVPLSLLAAGSGGSTSRWILDFFNAYSVDHLNHTASLLSDVILADGAPGGPRVRFSTALWLDHSLTLKPSFKHILHSHYRAAVNPVDFQTKAVHVGQQINSWAENEVSGRVKDIIREGSLNNNFVKLVFTNALYFKGAWDKRPGNLTVRLEPRENRYVAVSPLMIAKRKEYGWKDSYVMKFNHVYKKQSEDDPDFSMYFDFEYLPPRYQPSYSTFNISSNVEAANVLRGLGMTSPFSGGGELTKMLTCHKHSRELYVSSIFHKTFMEVNEQGTTEAAAATAAIIMSGCPPNLPPVARLFEF